jgi:hypothetical protein
LKGKVLQREYSARRNERAEEEEKPTRYDEAEKGLDGGCGGLLSKNPRKGIGSGIDRTWRY